MNLFEKVLSDLKKKITATEGNLDAVAKILSDEVHMAIEPSALAVKKGTLYIRVSPTLKMAIMLKKEPILGSFKANNIAIYTIA